MVDYESAAKWRSCRQAGTIAMSTAGIRIGDSASQASVGHQKEAERWRIRPPRSRQLMRILELDLMAQRFAGRTGQAISDRFEGRFQSRNWTVGCAARNKSAQSAKRRISLAALVIHDSCSIPTFCCGAWRIPNPFHAFTTRPAEGSYCLSSRSFRNILRVGNPSDRPHSAITPQSVRNLLGRLDTYPIGMSVRARFRFDARSADEPFLEWPSRSATAPLTLTMDLLYWSWAFRPASDSPTPALSESSIGDAVE